MVYGVLEKFRSCLIEMLLDSKRVKIDGLGTFFTTIENEKGGAISEEKFSVNTNLKALHIRFLPEQEQEMNISSREFFKKAEFINIDTLKGGGPSTPSQGPLRMVAQALRQAQEPEPRMVAPITTAATPAVAAVSSLPRQILRTTIPRAVID